jgi:hypothetical protein
LVVICGRADEDQSPHDRGSSRRLSFRSRNEASCWVFLAGKPGIQFRGANANGPSEVHDPQIPPADGGIKGCFANADHGRGLGEFEESTVSVESAVVCEIAPTRLSRISSRRQTPSTMNCAALTSMHCIIMTGDASPGGQAFHRRRCQAGRMYARQ